MTGPLQQRLAALPDAQAKALLGELLQAYTQPVFGALPKAELELAMLRAMQGLGLLPDQPTLYELIATLRVTRAKARALLYALELRRSDAAQLDARLKTLLRAPLLLKQGELFGLEIENPLLADHLKDRLQRLGHASDGSFSPTLVTLKLEALVALLQSFVAEQDQDTLRQALIKAGAPNTSFTGLLTAGLKKLGAKLAEEAGAAAAEKLSDTLGPLLDAVLAPVVKRLGPLLGELKPSKLPKP